VALEALLDDGRYAIVASHYDAVGALDATRTAPLVVDGTPPTLSLPAEIVAEATSQAGAVVAFDAGVEDALDAAPAVVCDPASGSTFPLAPTPTPVVCTATDRAGNSVETSFPVTVRNTVSPARVAAFTARAAHRVVALTWRRPTDWDYDHVAIYRASPGSGWTLLGTRSTQTSFADHSVANDRVYRYRIESVDTASNRSTAAELSARPSAFFRPSYLAAVRAPVLLEWVPVARATYYNLQVWRNGRKVLSRWPTRARFELRSSWRFAGRTQRLRPGRYTAYAWPGYGPKRAARYGPLRGWTAFIVR
jgi:HYR domain-containing protein